MLCAILNIVITDTAKKLNIVITDMTKKCFGSKSQGPVVRSPFSLNGG